MRILSAIGNFLKRWYIAGPAMAVVGVAIGYAIFYQAFPSQPKIGVIDIPFTGIDEGSAAIITSYLDYARRNSEIKAVVIKLGSPGGGASASEQLYHETAKLREEKPVVMVMNGMVASGGYMMAMGVNHTYAKTSTLVGNVGVVAGTGSIYPPQIPEQIAFTGPYKLTGFSRRDWISGLDMLKEAFVEMVVSERGDRLKITREEVANGQLYTGMEAVALGLVDEVGSDADAFNKAAELAGIRNYDTVNVNVEVNRLFVQDLRRIYSSGGDVDTPLTEADIQVLNLLANRSPMLQQYDPGAADAPSLVGEDPTGPGIERDIFTTSLLEDYRLMHRPMEYGILGAPAEAQFPNLPLEVNRPQFYYLYVGADH